MDALYPTISLGGDLLNWKNISAQVGKVCRKILSISVNLLGGKKRKEILLISMASLVITLDPGETNAMDVPQRQEQQVQQKQGTQKIQHTQTGYNDGCFVPRGFSHLDGDPNWKTKLINTLNSLDESKMTKEQAEALFHQLSQLNEHQRNKIVVMLSKKENEEYAIKIKRMLELLYDILKSMGLIVDPNSEEVGIKTIHFRGNENFKEISTVDPDGYITVSIVENTNTSATKSVTYYLIGFNKEGNLDTLKVVTPRVRVRRK